MSQLRKMIDNKYMRGDGINDIPKYSKLRKLSRHRFRTKYVMVHNSNPTTQYIHGIIPLEFHVIITVFTIIAQNQ